MPNLNPEQLIAIENITKNAGKILLKYWRYGKCPSSENGFKIVEKPDGSPVSSADLESSTYIESEIKKIFPNDVVVTEENGCSIDRNERVWVVDPLDGTKSFLSGRDDFSVLVSLVERGEVIAGCMFFPARSLCVHAVAGKGAMCDGHPIRVAKSTSLREKSVYIRHFSPEGIEKWKSPQMDSGLAFLLVASGFLDGLVIKMRCHREWDIAAPSIVITESGGKITDEKGNKITLIESGKLPNYVVASNNTLHEELLNLIPSESGDGGCGGEYSL